MKYVEVKIGEYEIPLIGIPVEYGLETCDLCGDNILKLYFDIDKPKRKFAILAGNGKNIYCNQYI